MKRQGKITNLLLVLSLAVFLFGSGYKLGQYNAHKNKIGRPSYNIRNASSDQKVKDLDFGLFWETWDKVEQKFIDKKKIDPQKMFYGSVKGLVNSLDDPYTFFLTPEENKQSKDDLGGKFEGIGAQLGLKNNSIIIIAPLKNSPAEKAGIKTGDIILKVDGQPTKDWTLPQAVSKIRGPKGTRVELTFLRGNKEFTLKIEREEIKVTSIEVSEEKKQTCLSVGRDSKQKCDKVAYLKINQFGDNTNNEWDNAIDKVEQQWRSKTIKGIVLDLRDNPGGFLDSSVYVASEFLPTGKLVVKQESTVTDTKEYYVLRQGRLLDIPLVILINQGSASASEILAGALRDYKRAPLIGEKTFGKGSVQEALDLRQGAGLHVTVAKWILPEGAWINGKGIEPTQEVKNEIKEGNTLTRETDKQLETAVGRLVQ